MGPALIKCNSTASSFVGQAATWMVSSVTSMCTQNAFVDAKPLTPLRRRRRPRKRARIQRGAVAQKATAKLEERPKRAAIRSVEVRGRTYFRDLLPSHAAVSKLQELMDNFKSIGCTQDARERS